MRPDDALVRRVRDHLRYSREAGDIVFADELDLSTDGGLLVFTADVVAEPCAAPVRRLAVHDIATGGLELHPEPLLPSHSGAWSPDGDRLAWLVARETGAELELSDSRSPVPARFYRADGEIEFLRWSPDGTRLLLGVADAGADRSDVVGSGKVSATATSTPSWTPHVETSGAAAAGRRRLLVYDAASGTAEPVGVDGRTVWDAAWAGASDIVCVVSDGPDESSWYRAELIRLSVTRAGDVTTLIAAGADQVCMPSANPSGTRVSAIVGAMSDRGLDTGSLWVNGTIADVGSVDVTFHRWNGEDTVVFAGLCGLRTVVGRYDADSAGVEVIWDSTDTTGNYGPTVAVGAGRVAACVHGYARPPQLALLETAETVLRDLDIRWAPTGSTTNVSWRSVDGELIDGLLTVPAGPGPHPLVVHVHGGPVWAWRNSWSMHYPYTPLFVEHGYAVLHPNGRGGSGRGQRFIRRGLQDMGGIDTWDILAGVDAVASRDDVDGIRVGITGNSYGGYMAAWLPTQTDRFAAAASRSPVTDWVSQHYTSNIPGFDRCCFTGDPLAADSDHRQRSPLYLADRISTPMLLMAGANDLATPPDQAAILHRALTERGKASTLVVYPEEGHGVRTREALVDQCARMLEFFDTYLALHS